MIQPLPAVDAPQPPVPPVVVAVNEVPLLVPDDEDDGPVQAQAAAVPQLPEQILEGEGVAYVPQNIDVRRLLCLLIHT